MAPKCAKKTRKSTLTNCLNKTTTGCEGCESGYYLEKKRCNKCEEECTTCESKEVCTSCKEGLILKDKECYHLSIVQHCIKASNNKCSQCKEGYELSQDGLSCIEKTNYGMIIGISVGSVGGIVLIIFVFLLIISYIIIHQKNMLQLVF